MDARTLLELMLADLEDAPELYRPTDFWRTGLEKVVADLRERGFAEFRRHPSARFFYAPQYAPVSRPAAALSGAFGLVGSAGKLIRERIDQVPVARAHHATVQALDPADRAPVLTGFSESTAGAPAEQLVLGGRRFSRSSLNYLRGLVMLKRAVPDLEISTVCEIGGGFGTLGEILLARNEGLRYIDVDIPPVAAVATHYLREVLGESRVLDYAATRDREKIAIDEIEHPATVLCSWQLPRLTGTVDLFANFISFQEMEPDVVENYARLVTDLGARWLLLRNSPSGKPGVREPMLRHRYLELFDRYELVDSDAGLYGQDSEATVSEVMVLARRS
ncbi:putative sugar O-methyltransferase [Pseudonocardia ammonioxydans]|uniref:Putative sugar O-methyltransferase n=1 Tax=Pseudonocardia ammonioxydans TaxID=260086 RepID=A0A1I4WTI9_PSUAM|nr:putative sugar O-methyltransferase [Pseudonocardia ammonioxydans]SFN16672.1 putative sugar O-methyltransferase [Pseudonocardia ammonioxydans]